MISISCLESKLLNNNNWYGRFQLAPFQKGEGLTVANALRRTLLAEKSNFFITWVDFYNAEIPYSVLTGMRESIFDILLNLKQVIFTSDKILPNNSHPAGPHPAGPPFFKMPLNNNFRAQKIKSNFESNFFSGLAHPHSNKIGGINSRDSKNKKIEIPYSFLLKHGPIRDLNNLNHGHLKTQNIFCQNQILGKIINCKNERSLRIFHKYSGSRDQLLDTSNSKKTNNSTFIGYICAKGPATIYAKNIKLPKGLKCVDPDKYITTLADDGLFYLRFALTTEIKTLPLNDTSNLSININQGIQFNTVRFKTFPKTLFNKEIQSCFDTVGPRIHKLIYEYGGPQINEFMLNQEKKSNQYYLKTNQTSFFGSHSNNLFQVQKNIEPNNYYTQKYSDSNINRVSRISINGGLNLSKQKYPHSFFRLDNIENRRKIQYGSTIELHDFKLWPIHSSKNLINQQRLLLTNDSVKQFNFQNTSIIANIQKTCMLNIQIKHYYYKCGRFDRFLFDLIKPFKPDLISIYYKKPCLKKKKNIFDQDTDWKVFTYFQKTFERQKFNSHLLIDYKQNHVKKLVTGLRSKGRPIKNFLGSFSASVFSNFRGEVGGQKKSGFVPPPPPDKAWPDNNYKNTNASPFFIHKMKMLKWQKIFKFLKRPRRETNSIYDYLQKLNRTQATHIYFLFTKTSSNSKISLLGSQLILNNDPKAQSLSDILVFLLKNKYFCPFFPNIFDDAWFTKSESSTKMESPLKMRRKTSDNFSFNNLRSRDSIEGQASGFLFSLPRVIESPMAIETIRHQEKHSALFEKTSEKGENTGESLKQKSSYMRMNNEQIQSDLSIFRLHEPYIKKFLNICLLFGCLKNHIVYFLKSYILQYINSPDFFNKNPAYTKNTSLYSPFKLGPISIEKLITKIEFLKQWSFLRTKHKKQTKISLLDKKTYLFPWVNSLQAGPFPAGVKQKKLLELLYLNKNKISKYDNNLREFFYSKNRWSAVTRPSFNKLSNGLKKVGFLSTSNKYPFFKKPSFFFPVFIEPFIFPVTRVNRVNHYHQRYPTCGRENYSALFSTASGVAKGFGGHELFKERLEKGTNNSVQISTNLRAKPSISIQQISYKPVWIFQCQFKFEQNIDKPPFWFDNRNLGNPRQTPKNNSVVLKPIYLNIEQIIYILKQTTKFRKNQRVNPIFFNSLTRLKNNNRYPLDYEFLFSKVSTFSSSIRGGPCFSNRYLSNSINKSHLDSHRFGKPKKQMRPYFFFKRPHLDTIGNTKFGEKKINNKASLGRETNRLDFVNCKTQMLNQNYIQRPVVSSHVRILGNDFVFKNNFSFTTCKSQSDWHFKYLMPLNLFNGKKGPSQFFDYSWDDRITKQLIYSKPSFNKASIQEGPSFFSDNFSLLNLEHKLKLKNFSNKPYNTNIFHSKISFNLRYTYPFKYTIFETFLPFLNSIKLRQETIGSSNFDYIHYNESFKIYTSLAYTCLKTYELHVPKYHNFNKRNKKKSQNSNHKVISFQLFESLIQNWPSFQKNTQDWIFNIKNEKSDHREGTSSKKSNVYPFSIMADQLPSILNSTYKWRIMNNSNFNDAFIMIPCTWFLNFQGPAWKLYGSANLRPSNKSPHLPRITNFSYSFVPPLKKFFYMDYSLSAGPFQNKSKPIFFDSFDEKKEIIKNKLDWLSGHLRSNQKIGTALKTTITTNELTWLRFYPEKKNFVYEFPVKNKNNKEGIYNLVDSQAEKDFSQQNNFFETLEQNNISYVKKPTLSKFKMKTSLKKLAISFENIYYKNFLWNSRKITLRILSNAILPLVSNRKYSISNFIQKKNYQANAFINNTPIPTIYFSPKFLNPFSGGFKQKIRPYLNVLKTDAWSQKNFDNMFSYSFPIGPFPYLLFKNKTINKHGKDQLSLSNEFSGETFSGLADLHSNKIGGINSRDPKIYQKQPFCSVRHKTLGTTNFMCSKTYPTFINQNQIQKRVIWPYNKLYGPKPPNDSLSSFSDIDILPSSFTTTNELLKDQNYLPSSTNKSYTQKSDDFFSESFSSLRSKWKPFFTGSLKYFQEKNTPFGSLFLNFATQKKVGIVSANETNENDLKLSLIHNLWSSLFFCKYSFYAISIKSDLFFQNLISNHSLNPSTNKIEIPETTSKSYIKNFEEPFFKDPLMTIPPKIRQQNKMQSQFYENNIVGPRTQKLTPPTSGRGEDTVLNSGAVVLNAKPSLKSYYETIQKILKFQNHQLTNYVIANHDYYWQKAVHFVILSRSKISKFNNKKKVESNWDKNSRNDSFFLQYPKKRPRPIRPRLETINYNSQNSISGLKNKYSIRRLKNYERYFGNPLRRHISQNGLRLSAGSFLAISRVEWPEKKTNQHVIKSWKSIIWTAEADIYFCFRYPLFIQNCNLPWQKSKKKKKHWLNRITIDLKLLSKLTSCVYLSKRPRRETDNINAARNSSLLMRPRRMTYTQLSSSSNKTHQPLLHSKLLTNITSPIHMHIQNKGSYGTIGYFTIKESLNSIYKVNYIVESQVSESKSMSELTFNSNQNQRFRKLSNPMENFQNMTRFENIQRDSMTTDSLTVSNFLNGTYSFFPSKTIMLNSFNELMNSQNRFEIENENEYIQIDIWTNGELSPRQALLNAFRKLFELFYNLSKYNCLKPIEI